MNAWIHAVLPEKLGFPLSGFRPHAVFRSRMFLLVMLGAVALGSLRAAEPWVEVLSPAMDLELAERTSVAGLRAFDGRLYIRLGTPSNSNSLLPILAHDPAAMATRTEVARAGPRLGEFRVLDGVLHVPVSTGGCFVSAGNARWDYLAAVSNAWFRDAARRDGKTFLAGSLGDEAIVAWRPDNGQEWNVEHLRQQAARVSLFADRFLAGPDLLSLLALRDLGAEWPADRQQAPPREWGAWYLLHFQPDRSVRGFWFDGKARQTPVLEALAPGSSLSSNSDFAVHADAPFRDGLLFTLRGRTSGRLDPRGGLFFARPEPGTFLTGRTWVSRRIPGLELARDLAVEADTCAVLLAADASCEARVLMSRDLESWPVSFAGTLPAPPTAIGLLSGRCYLGLEDGTVLRLESLK